MKAAHLRELLPFLQPYPKTELERTLEALPVSFLLKCEERKPETREGVLTLLDDKRFGYFNLEDGFYSIVRSGYHKYEDSKRPYKMTGYAEHHVYLRVTHGSYDDNGVIKSYFMSVPNNEESSCDCGQYLWDKGSIYGGYSDNHGSILFVRKLLPFEIINLKFKLYKSSRRNKLSSSIFKPKPRN